MSGQEVAALIGAGVAVFGAIMSVLLLSFRVGRLVGTVDGFIQGSTADRAQLHSDIGTVERKIDQHVSWHGGGRR